LYFIEMAAPSASWWERELPAIAAEMRSTLNARLRVFSGEHDDLVNDTLLALSNWVQLHKERVERSSGEPLPDGKRQLRALAMTILRRRIADLFRAHVHDAGPVNDSDERLFSEAQTEPIAAPERTVLIRHIFALTSAWIGTLPKDDADLLVLGSPDALTDRERQRVHRLRDRLNQVIETALGMSFAEALDKRD
jgi:DNA-directed RNA polymerase specialized sigma24 family protein